MVPEDEYGRCILSWALANAGRSVDAVAELKHAIALNPHYPTAHSDLAEQYAILGLSEEAIAEAREAMRLGSVDPIDFWRHYGIVVAQFAAGNYAEALGGARKVLTLKPGLVRGALFLAASAATAGEADEAAAAIALCRAKIPDLRLGNVAPGVLPRYVQDEHHERFIAMLRKAGLPE
jgi:Flp pilus assembly protein TadD